MAELTNIKNFRDLAYLGKIKPNKLFRSGSIDIANKDEILLLKEKYHISTIIDLRNSVEIYEKPDCLFDQMVYHKCSLQEKCDESIAQDSQSVQKRKEYFQKLDKQCQDDSFALKHMQDFYYSLASSKEFSNGFKHFCDILLDSENAVLWHCSLGRDRAGVVSALLLSILGFDYQSIELDYMRSNEYCGLSSNKCYDLANKTYLQTFYKSIKDVKTYLDDIGINEEMISRLRNKYLED